jgi:hypothetical protein
VKDSYLLRMALSMTNNPREKRPKSNTFLEVHMVSQYFDTSTKPMTAATMIRLLGKHLLVIRKLRLQHQRHGYEQHYAIRADVESCIDYQMVQSRRALF